MKYVFLFIAFFLIYGGIVLTLAWLLGLLLRDGAPNRRTGSKFPAEFFADRMMK